MKCAVKNNLILLLAFLLCGCGGYLPAEKTRWQVNKGEQYFWYPPDETVLSQRRANQLWLDNLTHEIETLFINHATISDQELHIYETINKTDPQINTMKLNYPNRRDEIGVLSDDIKSMSEDLKNQINEIRGFAADVSHELKNPLASLKNSNEVLYSIFCLLILTIPEVGFIRPNIIPMVVDLPHPLGPSRPITVPLFILKFTFVGFFG